MPDYVSVVRITEEGSLPFGSARRMPPNTAVCVCVCVFVCLCVCVCVHDANCDS